MLPNDDLSHLEEMQGAGSCTASEGAQLANAPQDLAVLHCVHCPQRSGNPAAHTLKPPKAVGELPLWH